MSDTPELLGHRVRDVISNYEGVAYSFVEFLSGTDQYSVIRQVLASEATLPEERSFDVPQLRILTEEPVSEATPRQLMTHVDLGNEVEDITSGFKGIATRRYTFLNGCVYYVVQGKATKDGKVPDVFTEQKLLKYKGVGVKRALQAIAKAKPVETKKPPGGPSLSAPRRIS